MKRALSVAARVILTAGFIALALSMVRIGDLLSIAARVDKLALAGLAVLLVVPIFLTAIRWRMLMAANGIEVPLGRVFLVNYAGAFFNTFLPGAVGGDIAKAVIATRGEERKTARVGTILLDRIVGLVAMILMAVVAVVPFAGDPRMRHPVAIVALLLGGLIVLYPLYGSRRLRESALGRWVSSRVPFARIAGDLDAVFLTMHRARWTQVKALLLSAVSQAALIGVIFLMSRAMGMERPTLGQFFLFEPIIFIVTAVPLSIGGWGVQESVYALLFGMAGVPASEAIALSLIYKFGLVAVSLPGGMLVASGLLSRKRGT